MAMTKPKPINVLFVASASAAVHGGAAVLFVPALSFLMLFWGAAPLQLQGTVMTLNDGMVFAVLAPLAAAVFGFAAGALVAIGHNFFAEGQRKHALAIKEPQRARSAASLSNAA